ncbi:MAG: Mut7-C RNAse domain-containing protein [Deltaproteobacteria bacterium]|nr:Mut7-C RNAse domain-containing protein [Deltaproteobacteria bacterium]
MSGDNAARQRFFADAMLGSLARWLRVMGYDCAYEKSIEDGALVERAVDEDRVILTRDTLIMGRKKARGRVFFINSNAVEGQIREVRDGLGLDVARFLTRCLRCNVLLEDAPKETVREKAPSYVYDTQDAFSRCPACGRVYWSGTHGERMLEEVERFLKG